VAPAARSVFDDPNHPAPNVLLLLLLLLLLLRRWDPHCLHRPMPAI
jgi:hypothetical protein